MNIHLERRTWIRGSPLPDGEGGFGKVFDVQDEDGNAAVAKFVLKDAGAERELLMGDSVRAAGFRNVVPVLDKGEHEDQWVIVMPKATRSLSQHLQERSGSLELVEVVSILRDIAIALADISGEIVHRDLKPQNILWLEDKWCIADFGIARYAEASTGAHTRKYSMTEAYAAPEQWNFKQATSATDVYAFGVIAYQLLSGNLPFAGPDLRDQHLTATPPRLIIGTARLRTLIEECLFKAADARPTAANILARLGNAADEPIYPGLARLAQVNQAEVQRLSENQARAAKEQQRADYLAEMYKAAVQSFQSLSNPLLQAVEDNAPSASIVKEFTSTDSLVLFSAALGKAVIGVSKPQQAIKWGGPFSVIANAEIFVRIRGMGWQGRVHSLWFCDAHEKGRFAWYETAFMGNPFIGEGRTVEPFSLLPHEGKLVFDNLIGKIQLAWPVEEIDRADPSDFFDRWIGWFASAAEGNLRRPATMPEKQPQGSWRKS